MSKFDYVVDYKLKTGNVLVYGLVCPINKTRISFNLNQFRPSRQRSAVETEGWVNIG